MSILGVNGACTTWNLLWLVGRAICMARPLTSLKSRLCRTVERFGLVSRGNGLDCWMDAG